MAPRDFSGRSCPSAYNLVWAHRRLTIPARHAMSRTSCPPVSPLTWSAARASESSCVTSTSPMTVSLSFAPSTPSDSLVCRSDAEREVSAYTLSEVVFRRCAARAEPSPPEAPCTIAVDILFCAHTGERCVDVRRKASWYGTHASWSNVGLETSFDTERSAIAIESDSGSALNR